MRSLRMKKVYSFGLALAAIIALLVAGCTSAGQTPSATAAASREAGVTLGQQGSSAGAGKPASAPALGAPVPAPIAPAPMGVSSSSAPAFAPDMTGAPMMALQQASSQQMGIWVSGLGQVTATPDIAMISLGVETKGDTVAEANSKAIDAMNAIMASLEANGIKKNDIRTQYFNIMPEYLYRERQEPIIVGYRVSNTVQAKIRTIDKVGKIIDDVVKAGGNPTRVQGINFSVDNPKPIADQARKLAMDDANAKAKQLAAEGGVTLGKPTFISESSYTPIPVKGEFRAMAAPAAAMDTPINPGETQIQVSVQVVYSIQ